MSPQPHTKDAVLNDTTPLPPHRRFSDPPSLDISQMIAAENDPKQRASLIVLHAISLSLEANTTTVRDISAKLEKHLDAFDRHATKEEQLINQGRGAWRIIAWVLAGVQVIAIVLWNETRSAQKDTQAELARINTALQASYLVNSKIEARLSVLEAIKK